MSKQNEKQKKSVELPKPTPREILGNALLLAAQEIFTGAQPRTIEDQIAKAFERYDHSLSDDKWMEAPLTRTVAKRCREE